MTPIPRMLPHPVFFRDQWHGDLGDVAQVGHSRNILLAGLMWLHNFTGQQDIA